MRFIYSFLIIAITFMFASLSFAQSDQLSLPFLIGSKQVYVLGESYGQKESAEFFSKTITGYVNGGGCLKVGLEISSDQQETLDSAMKGQVSISEIKINDIIDSEAYRQMLSDLSGQIKAGRCLSVHAIDAPASVPVSRDAWMEKEVVRLIGDTPVVILVGNARAVKNSGAGTDDSGKMLAERLSSRAIGVASTVQYWEPGQCEDRTAEYVSTSDEKAGLYVKESVGNVTTQMPEDPKMIADGVLVWSCESTTISEDVDVKDDGIVADRVSIEDKKTDVVVRDEKALKKIRWGIKNNYPIRGMTKDEAIEALGKPNDVKDSVKGEVWSYTCFDSDGFWYTCFVLTFKDGIAVDVRDFQ
jgi:hypothetical protein